MRYLGGKGPLGVKIAAVIEPYRRPGQVVIDVCCGALNVSRHLAAPRIAIDICEPLIVTLRAGLAGWRPPVSVSRERYDWQRRYGSIQDPLTGFLMFGRSYGGKAWGGYIADYYGAQNQGASASNSFEKKMRACVGTDLYLADCLALDPARLAGTIIYADPPYVHTTGYNAVAQFDHRRFWRCAEQWHQAGALVFVSEERTLSRHFRPIKVWPKRLALARHDRSRIRIEKLFAHREYFG